MPQAGPGDAATRNAGLITGSAGSAAQHSAAHHTAQPQPGNGQPGTAQRSAGPRNSTARRGAHRAGGRGVAAQAASGEIGEAEQLKETVAQLERALTVRVRVEQAIGVLAERHRIRPRQAFELLRSASRARGQRIMETASQVIASATNPLLRLPDELAKPPMPRRMARRNRGEA
ncbi:MAG TPA: ANTAR domain-containing protein [Streptosporangiaceae bacterium]|nr:ANTAR domain-containing protein [Streptosporangiaceae bacterium]